MKRFLSLSIALIWLSIGSAQTHKANLSEIESDGLYKLLLPFNVRAASTNKLDYLRIKDTAGSDIPFVIIDASDKQYYNFKGFEILATESIEDSISALTFSNQASLKSTLTLKIKNTDINKEYSLYGSDNQKEWFGLLDQRKLNLNGSSSETLLEVNISLPLNNYRFLKIVLNDKNSIPILVEEIGVYESNYFPTRLVPLDVFETGLSIEKNKTSRIEFSADRSHQVDAISFTIKNEFFFRKAAILVKKERKVKRTIEKYEEALLRFSLSSDKNNSMSMENTYLSNFILEVENEDNPPLSFEEIRFYQKPKYLVSYLKAGQDYKLIINDSLNAPSYDLAHFVSQNIDDLKEAQIRTLEELEENIRPDTKDKASSFWKSKLFMWLAIGLGGVLVLYFAITMLRDLSKS